MEAPVRFYYSITTCTPAVLPVLIVYGLYTTSNPFEVIIQLQLYNHVIIQYLYTCTNIPAALLTVDCLVIMLKDVQDRRQLGEVLRMGKDVLKSLDDYCNSKGESFLYHLISNWFRDGPEEPLKLLIAGLRSMGEDDIATTISQLFSIGTNRYIIL